MKPTMPTITIEGDFDNRIMARSGQIVGYTKNRIVWLFGFCYHSEQAKAHGCASTTLAWVLTTPNGNTLARFDGFAMDLPQRFRRVIDGKL